MLQHLRQIATEIDLSPLPNGPGGTKSEDAIPVIVGVVFAALGAISVLMIVIGGFQYVISQGDPQRVAKAKDTIMYAVIGLVISLLSYAIVAFVITEITK